MSFRFLISYFYPPTGGLVSKRGQSLVEILIATAVGVIMIVGAATIIIPALKGNVSARQIQTATALGREMSDDVRVFAGANWHNIYGLSKGSSNDYHLTTSSSPFSAVSSSESITISSTTYSRYFYVDNVNRDGSGDITAGSGTDDPSTQKITVVYSWGTGATSSLIEYLTRNGNKIFDQTDWSGGPGQDGPATTTNEFFSTSSNIDYTTTTGSIVIKGF